MIRFSSNLELSDEDRNYIKKSLPKEWETMVLDYNKNKELLIKINAFTPEDTKKWMISFESLTNTNYSINTAYNMKGKRIFYKKRYRCHHNTRHKETFDSVIRSTIKNTECPSVIIICIRTPLEKYQGKLRPPDSNKLCEIKIKMMHNHDLDKMKKFNKVSKDVTEKLLNFYSKGLNASAALKEIKSDIKRKYTNYEEIFLDRSKCPDYSFCYYLYTKYQNSLLHSNEDEETLSRIFDKYNKETNEISAELAICDKGITVSLCPPIARRVHKLENSQKLVFVESFASQNKNGNRFFLFLTYSEIGCLPLGFVAVSNENYSTTKIALSLFKEMLGSNGFFSHIEGPEIFITDEFLSQDNILTSIWPKSQIFLSIFHVLQNVWHWLSNSKNNITNEDRPLLFRDFYNLLYAENESIFNTNYDLAQESAKKYNNYEIFLQNYYERKEFWANYLKPNFLTDSNDNIKYSFSCIRFLRSNLFNNFKNFEFISIIEFVIKNYFTYFEKRLANISTNTIPQLFYTKNNENCNELMDKIQVLGPNMRLVPSKSKDETYYIINTDLLTCTCANANTGPLCKHVESVSTVLYQNLFQTNCNKYEIKSICNFLVKGIELNNSQTNNQEAETIEDTTQNEEIRNECLAVWKNIEKIFEENILESSENFAPILRQISTKFQNISSVDDLKATFNIFETGSMFKISKSGAKTVFLGQSRKRKKNQDN